MSTESRLSRLGTPPGLGPEETQRRILEGERAGREALRKAREEKGRRGSPRASEEPEATSPTPTPEE